MIASTLRFATLLGGLLCAGSAMAADSSAPTTGPAEVAQARDLLDTMRFENLMRRMLLLINEQPIAGEPREAGDAALLQRWLAATPMQAISAQAAQRLAGQFDRAQIAEGLAYFRSPAGQTELSCVHDAPGTPLVGECIRERGGEAQWQAHQAFAAGDLQGKLGDALGDSFGPELFAAAASALERDAALKREVDGYCARRPSGLCAMIASAQTSESAP